MGIKNNLINKLGGAKDMTKGRPGKRLIEFSIPLLIGNFAQQLYSTVDSIIVGKYVGDEALAAIGASGALVFLLMVLFIGISMGAGILVSQYFGAKNKERLSRTIGNAIILNAVISVIIMVLGVFFIRPFLELLRTPEAILDMAVSYTMISCLGIMGTSYYNILSGLLRGMGDSVMPLFYLIICTITNIVLDLIFVGPMGMGVAGAAYATIISQIISAILCYLRMLKMKDVLTLDINAFKLDGKLSKQLIRLGLPVGITQALFAVAAIFVQNLTNTFGTVFIAASTVVMRVDGFAMLPNFTFGTAMTTYAGQNVGAMEIGRMRQGTKEGLKIGVTTSVVLVGLILIFGKILMGLFTNTDEVINVSYEMMCILSIGYIGVAINQILSGTIRGAGDTMTPMWIALVTTTLIRLPIAYGMAYFTRSETLPNGEPRSIYYSLVFAWVLGAIITAIIYKAGHWAKRARIGGKIVDISNMD